MIRRLLVANRGEIAVRIMRTAKEMGIRTVAVYSEADRDAMHVQFADEALPIGPSEPAASYLNIPVILQAAKSSGADAIHPGYGFLSERPVFAEAVEQAGLVFVGPGAAAMTLLGSKIEAKQLAQKAGVPLVPGFFEPGASDAQIIDAAKAIGLPVMLKASAGGGGRGMRAVFEEADLAGQLALAREEAVKAFGDGAMFVEKLIQRPRHVEVQVLADGQGSAACLFERECSIQRRHQKLVEESPSPIMSDRLWNEMREAARRLVLEAGYKGAGTVEFITDAEGSAFYFLEVNARLQVEHPVTEMVTGLDLVRWQLEIAGGARLSLPVGLMEGARSSLNGHSIEARVVAEDAAHGFLPSIGRILGWAGPAGPGVRFDTGFAAGSEVSRYYDSLLAKVIVHAQDRASAIDRLIHALRDTHILGVKTNIPFLLDVLEHPGFRSGDFDTGFVDRELTGWTGESELPAELAAIADHAGGAPTARYDGGISPTPGWDAADGFRITHPR